MFCDKFYLTKRIFAVNDAFCRVLDSVVKGIADKVHQRVVQFVDNCFIQFSISTFDDKFNFFAQLLGNVTDSAAEFIE